MIGQVHGQVQARPTAGFTVAGPSLGNSLPAALWRQEMTLHTFKWQLKAYLFHIWCVDEQKKHPPPPVALAAFSVILALDTKLSTYLLTYLGVIKGTNRQTVRMHSSQLTPKVAIWIARSWHLVVSKTVDNKNRESVIRQTFHAKLVCYYRSLLYHLTTHAPQNISTAVAVPRKHIQGYN